MSSIFNSANFFWMEPPDSSAARMPFPGATRLAAMRSRLSVGFAMMAFSSSSVRTESRLALSMLARAILRLSSTVLPRRKAPRTVAEVME